MTRRFFPVWPVVAAVSGVVAGIAALWSKSRHRDAKSRHGDAFCVLPWVSLILALQENVERLQLDVDNDWDDFVRVLLEKLGAVEKELLTVRDTSALNGLDKVTKVIDAELVDYLRAVPVVASILDSYMPRPGQEWKAFLANKTEDEKLFFDLEITEKSLQVKLTESLLESIQQVKSILVQSCSADASRYVPGQPEVENITRRYKIVKILYATDREVTTDGEYIGKISRRPLSALQREVPLQYGWVEVGIPEDHKIGSLERPVVRSKEEADPSKHVVIFSVNTNLRGDFGGFLECVNSDLTTNGGDEGELLVFIHGYNVSHLKAVKRAAQLKCDLEFQGTVILYSWSSKGTLEGYFPDQKNVKATADSLKQFLKLIMSEGGSDEVKSPRVHILAHSMGNRALIEALQDLYGGEDQRPIRYPLSQIIFVAADESRELFKRLVQTIKAADQNGVSSNIVDTGPHLSVYCSIEDWPLALSRRIHGNKRRLGDTHSLFESEELLDDHDVIDTSGTNEGNYLGHSYHVDSPKVIQDIQILLATKTPARSRTLHQIRHRERSFFAIDNRPWTSGTTC